MRIADILVIVDAAASAIEHQANIGLLACRREAAIILRLHTRTWSWS